MNIYRSLALAPADQRDALVQEFDLRDGTRVRIDAIPLNNGMPPAPVPLGRELRVNTQLVPTPQAQRPREMLISGGREFEQVEFSIASARRALGRYPDPDAAAAPVAFDHLPDRVLHHDVDCGVADPVGGAAVDGAGSHPGRRRRGAGRDVNAPPLPETGPSEIATASAAFNTMAARIRRFVQDRTFMLTAIGHDLRTPITRLRLRAEFMDDEEQQRKMLADLDELESMVSATLAFGRDAASEEAGIVDRHAELARTVLDETATRGPMRRERLVYAGPDHLTVRVRPVSLKRAADQPRRQRRQIRRQRARLAQSGDRAPGSSDGHPVRGGRGSRHSAGGDQPGVPAVPTPGNQPQPRNRGNRTRTADRAEHSPRAWRRRDAREPPRRRNARDGDAPRLGQRRSLSATGSAPAGWGIQGSSGTRSRCRHADGHAARCRTRS